MVGLTADEATCKQLALSWGVEPALVKPFSNTRDLVRRARQWLLSNGLAQKGQSVIIVAGIPVGTPGATNLLKVLEL